MFPREMSRRRRRRHCNGHDLEWLPPLELSFGFIQNRVRETVRETLESNNRLSSGAASAGASLARSHLFSIVFRRPLMRPLRSSRERSEIKLSDGIFGCFQESCDPPFASRGSKRPHRRPNNNNNIRSRSLLVSRRSLIAHVLHMPPFLRCPSLAAPTNSALRCCCCQTLLTSLRPSPSEEEDNNGGKFRLTPATIRRANKRQQRAKDSAKLWARKNERRPR